MLLFYGASIIFLISILLMVGNGVKAVIDRNTKINETFMPKSRTEMIKGLAAIAIVFSHIASHSSGLNITGIAKYYIQFCKTWGFIGVNLFFLISGYGNYISIKKVNTVKSRLVWLVDRVLKLLVIYLICYFVGLVTLYLLGYRTSFAETYSNIIKLRGQLTTAWYVRIQLLVYCFLFISTFIKKEGLAILCLFICVLCLSNLLYRMGYEDYWWKSTLCFPAGFVLAAKREQIKKVFRNKFHVLLAGAIILFPVAYILEIATDLYLLKIIGNVLLSLDMLCLAEMFQVKNVFYERVGKYSLTLYLAHISLNAWILSERILTNIKFVEVFMLSLILAFAAEQLGSRVFQKTMKVHRKAV